MNDNLNVNEDFVKSIVSQGKWGEQDNVKAEPITEDKKPVKSKKEPIEEEVEKHVCPLCESELDEPLDDEVVLEHMENVLTMLTEADEDEDEDEDSLNEDEDESDDEDEEVLEEADDEDDDEDEDEDSDDEEDEDESDDKPKGKGKPPFGKGKSKGGKGFPPKKGKVGLPDDEE